MSKEEIMMFIKEIDEQLKKNKEVIDGCDGDDVLILSELSQNLVNLKRTWVDILLCDYGVFYTGKRVW
jgi:hypothetical protein